MDRATCRQQVGAAFSKDDPTPGIFQDHAEELTPEEELAGEQAGGCSLTRLNQLPQVAEAVAALSSLYGRHGNAWAGSATSCQTYLVQTGGPGGCSILLELLSHACALLQRNRSAWIGSMHA